MFFEKEVYDNFNYSVKQIGTLIKKNNKEEIKKNAMDLVKLCSFDSEMVEKFSQKHLTHAEEKMYTFKIKQKEEQKRLFESTLARAIPSEDVLLEIKKFANDTNILEINSHRGLWAGLMRAYDFALVDVLAPFQSESEAFVPSLKWKPDESGFIPTPIELFRMIEQRYNILLLVKPRKGDESKFAWECLCNFKGERVIYIDDESNELLFDYLNEHFSFEGHADMPNWLNDIVHVQFYIKMKK